MRNFRTAAVAAATAATVAFGGVAVASAEDTTNERASLAENLSSVIKDTKADDAEYPTLSSKIGANADKDQKVTGHDLLGKEKGENNPRWGEIWRDGTVALGITSAIGALIGAYNYAVYNGILPQHILDPIFRR